MVWKTQKIFIKRKIEVWSLEHSSKCVATTFAHNNIAVLDKKHLIRLHKL